MPGSASNNTDGMTNKEKNGDNVSKPPKRTFEEELSYIRKVSDFKYEIREGFVPHMNVPAQIYVDSHIDEMLLNELEICCSDCSGGGFLPALKQVANVAALPGIVKASLAMPDVHSGYGFCIGYVDFFMKSTSFNCSLSDFCLFGFCHMLASMFSTNDTT